MYMKIIKPIILIIFIVAAVIWIFYPNKTIVISPRAGLPFISTEYNRLQIDYKTSVPFFKQDYKIYLKHIHNGKYYRLKILKHSLAVNNGKIVVGIRGLPAGEYDLILKTNKVSKNQKAIFIREKISDDLKIVQLADLPKINNIKVLKKIINEINIINPDVILITGDLTYSKDALSMKSLKKLFLRFNAPYIIAAGNHEYESWFQYLKHFRKTRHINEFGNFVVATLNSGHYRDQITFSQLEQIKSLLQNHKNKTVLWQIHHPVFGISHISNLQKEFIHLVKSYKSLFVISGHVHADDVFNEEGRRVKETNFSGIKFIITTTAGRDLRPKQGSCTPHYGYRLLRIKERKLINYTYDYDGDGIREPSCSIVFDKIKISYPEPNQILVKNNTFESFDRAMAKISYDGDVTKNVTGGKIKNKFFYKNITTFFIEFNLPAKSDKTITLTDANDDN
jgi:predicted phosphodiesterase